MLNQHVFFFYLNKKHILEMLLSPLGAFQGLVNHTSSLFLQNFAASSHCLQHSFIPDELQYVMFTYALCLD